MKCRMLHVQAEQDDIIISDSSITCRDTELNLQQVQYHRKIFTNVYTMCASHDTPKVRVEIFQHAHNYHKFLLNMMIWTEQLFSHEHFCVT